MKVLMINSVCGIKSTGRICTDLASALEKEGHVVKILYGRENVPNQFKKYAVRIGNEINVKKHIILSRLFDESGLGSKRDTERAIEWIKEYNPDVIHLHNIHGYYINIEVLFNYLKTCEKKIIWTLHDCWSFTGHCSYFTYVNCYKWINKCEKCPQIREYPKSLILDRSSSNFSFKKNLFTSIPNMTIVTPSFWLMDLVKKSFLKNYESVVIHNGINIEVFKKRTSNVRERYSLGNKKIVLGVAAVWNERKGLKTFIELSKILDDSFQIVLIGITKKDRKGIPPNIVTLEKTNNPTELAELYSESVVFVNPTLEDNFPTTNLEAIACGTPVITYDTGGSVESAKWYGCVVPKGNIEELKNQINKIDCFEKQIVDLSVDKMISDYLTIYK